ncbi:lytic transglycosylase domain-containing protein [Paenibacillus sp. GCM10027626]|uniref:lytic transglycosylase domain-containing protein n=1 Tax=Paenibacillus sp. GCM10027626 TaxID=3273411 RepID=UPI0036312020
MDMDPRIMKSLIQLQITPGVSGYTSNSSILTAEGPGGASLFGTLLQQFMAGYQADSGLERVAASTLQPSLYPMPVLAVKQDEQVQAPRGDLTGLDAIIANASQKYGIDESLIRAVIETESSFNPNTVSSAGAKGLMQLMDGTARGLGVTDSFDPQQNVEGGTRYLAYLMEKYKGNIQVALAAYNAGPGRVDRSGIATNADFVARQSVLPKETQNYVGKVLRSLAKYSAAAV